MLRSWKIGRAFGVDIFVHWTFWILPLFFIYWTKAYTLTTAALAVVAICVAFLFVVLHEFGHILVARAFGIGTRDVILTPLGGMARMERMSEKPLEEILISLAGPTVNVAAAFILGIGATVIVGSLAVPGPLKTPAQPIGTAGEILTMVIIWNIGMAIFNMLPAFPMDGGRIFRGVLAAIMDRVTATTIAVWVGTFVIGTVGLVFFLQGNLLALPLAARYRG